MYRKFTADHLFNGYQLLPTGSVLITDNEGRVLDISVLPEAGENIEHVNGLLCPGFVNAHCHLELSHMLGQIPEKAGLTDFLLKVIFERNFKEDTILTAIEAGETTMLQNGIVAVGDICNTTHTLAQKKLGRLRYHNFIETAGFISAGAQSRFNTSKAIYDEFTPVLPVSSIVPHAPYSVSPALFTLINSYSGNGLLTIHNQEAAAENDLFQAKKGDFLAMYQKMNIDISDFKPTGKSSLQSWVPQLTNYQSLILVHDVCTSAADVDFEKEFTKGLQRSKAYNNFQASATNIEETQSSTPQTVNSKPQTANSKPSTHYCLCPNANLYITGQLPDVNLLIEKDCSIVLGTDSLASNHQLSILAEMKTLQQHFSAVPLETLLQWATINGAIALEMGDKLGSFEKGKQPGLVEVSHMQGLSFSEASLAKRIL